MHATERERLILAALTPTGFITYRDLESRLDASPATIRRDLARLESAGQIVRVHGGARLVEGSEGGADRGHRLTGTPFDLAITRNLPAKRAIGRAAAALCQPGELAIGLRCAGFLEPAQAVGRQAVGIFRGAAGRQGGVRVHRQARGVAEDGDHGVQTRRRDV